MKAQLIIKRKYTRKKHFNIGQEWYGQLGKCKRRKKKLKQAKRKKNEEG